MAVLKYWENSKIVGVDRHELGQAYAGVLRTALRADPDLVVICNPHPSEVDFSIAQSAFLTGHNVLLIQGRNLAPADTKWLIEPIP